MGFSFMGFSFMGFGFVLVDKTEKEITKAGL